MTATLLLTIALVVMVVAVALSRTSQRYRTRYPLHLLDDGTGNESLIVEGTLAEQRVLFLLDTAYAGAPVLSISYMNCLRDKTLQRSLTNGNVQKRYMATVYALRSPISNYDVHESLNEFAGRGVCRAYTSGCTMRLMGIGETSESQSEMFLCPPLNLADRPRWRWDADVFVTNRLDGSPHILTSDYLLHRGPALIEPKAGRLTLHASPRLSDFDLFDAVLEGGAFVVPIRVGEKTASVVVDTGASTTLSLSKSVGNSLAALPKRRKVYQSGVNGENICSDVVQTDVAVGTTAFTGIDVLVNTQEVQGADGYLGIGVLRAFDLYLSHDHIGFRPNGLAVSEISFSSEGVCGKAT